MIDRFKTVFFAAGLAMAAFGMGSLASIPQTEAMSQKGVKSRINPGPQPQGWRAPNTNSLRTWADQRNRAQGKRAYVDRRTDRLLEPYRQQQERLQQENMRRQQDARNKQMKDFPDRGADRQFCMMQCQMQTSGTASDTFYACSPRC